MPLPMDFAFLWRPNSEGQRRAIEALSSHDGMVVRKTDGRYEITVTADSFDQAQDRLHDAYAMHVEPDSYVSVMTIEGGAQGSLALRTSVPMTDADSLEKIRLALAPVIDDLLDEASGVTFSFEVIEPSNQWEVLVSLKGEGTGLFVDADASLEEMTVSLADQFQEPLIEDANGAVPRCPLHEHPLRAVLESGVPRWKCPASPDEWNCRIGQLREAIRRGAAGV